MKLLLRRNQKAGMMGMGKIVFSLEVRAELTPEEQANVDKYNMGDVLLYSRKEFSGPTEGIKGLGAALMFRMTNLSIQVDDLRKGKKIDCKDIVEMMAAEQQVREAAATFKGVLEAAAGFKGEEIVEF